MRRDGKSMSEVYSEAPRCTSCGQRAVLSQQAAEHFAAASGGRLVVFACPHHAEAWHVFAPDIEKSHLTPDDLGE